MKVVAIIPSRIDSTRYPQKALADIHGLPMIQHVYSRTELSDAVDETYVATPDDEIKNVVVEFGGKVIMTGDHSTPVGRVTEAAQSINADIVITVQGDEPMIYPEMIETSVEPMLENKDIGVINLVKEIKSEEAFRNPNNPKVVMDRDSKALYFSREPIPNLKDVEFEDISVYKQVCLMPFRREFIDIYAELERPPLDVAEDIDMLRFLEHGYDVHLVETELETQSVDTPEDHDIVNEIMKNDDYLQQYK